VYQFEALRGVVAHEISLDGAAPDEGFAFASRLVDGPPGNQRSGLGITPIRVRTGREQIEGILLGLPRRPSPGWLVVDQRRAADNPLVGGEDPHRRIVHGGLAREVVDDSSPTGQTVALHPRRSGGNHLRHGRHIRWTGRPHR